MRKEAKPKPWIFAVMIPPHLESAFRPYPQQPGAFVSPGFTLFELLLVMLLMGILTAMGIGVLSLGKNALHQAGSMVVTAASSARSRALLMNILIRLHFTASTLVLSSPDGKLYVSESLPEGVIIRSVNGQVLTAKEYSACFLPRGVVQEHILILQADGESLSVYIPAVGAAEMFDGERTRDSIFKELL